MAKNTWTNKPEVLNPLLSLHTVGKELEDAFAAKKKDVALMGIKNLSEKKKLTERQLERARAILGLDAFYIDVLKKIQDEYEERLPAYKESYKTARQNYRKLKPVMPLLRNEFNDGFDRLDDILDFFGADSEEEIFQHIEASGTLYRSQTQTPIDDINLCAWIRRGELDFEKVKELLPQYNRTALQEWIDKGDWRKELKSTTYFKNIPQILRHTGVAVILLPYLQKTVYGAVKWIDGHPVVMISDREQDIATCWFTLFHEFGHVILHENQLSVDGAINNGEPKGNSAQREKDANKFANHYLFNGDELRKHIFELKRNDDYEPQDQIAKQFNVSPIFVGYWMRKAQYYPSQHIRIPISF